MTSLVLAKYPNDLANRYLSALTSLNMAYQNFDNSTDNYRDAAIYKVKAAREEFDSVFRELKDFNKNNTCKTTIFGV